MGYLWFRVKLWYRETLTKLRWRAAYALPREIALLAFVRVSSVLDSPSDGYVDAYRAFAAGQGR